MKTSHIIILVVILVLVGALGFIFLKKSFRTLSPVPDENAVKVIIVSPTIAQ